MDSNTIEEQFSSLSNRAIDNMLIITVLLVWIPAVSTVFRDITMEIDLFNSVINFSFFGILFLLWLFRKKISLNLKTILLVAVYYSVGVKSILLAGPFSLGIFFVTLCIVAVFMYTSIQNSIVISILLFLPLIYIGYLFINETIVIQRALNEESKNLETWITFFSFCVFVSFVLISTTHLLKSGITRLIDNLRGRNRKLINEIAIKLEYQEKLQLTNSKLRTLFQGSRDGVIMVNSKGIIVESNDTFLEMIDLKASKVLNKLSLYNIVHPNYLENVKKNISKLFAGEISFPLNEFEILRKNGKALNVEVNSNLIFTDQELFIMSAIRDVSYRKEIERKKFNIALEAEEKERERFSRDLHDEIGPVFSTLQLYLESLSETEKNSKRKETLDNLTNIVNRAVGQVREISHNMHPYILKGNGLVQTLETYLSQINESGKIQTIYNKHGLDHLSLGPHVDVIIYRSIMELVNNTIKHSSATKLGLDIKKINDKLEIIYYDNGDGFDIDKFKDSDSGLGLQNIITRIKNIKGTIRFDRLPDKMLTEIQIELQ